MEDIQSIHALIARFATSFDVKDWNGLQACLTDSLFTDYSDLRGTPPQTISSADYVAIRRDSLGSFKLHHLVGNYEVDFPALDQAACRASMIVWRKSDEGQSTSHCIYNFQLTRQVDGWRISGITQRVLWNEETSFIHKGAG
jgi:hypothetical protein